MQFAWGFYGENMANLITRMVYTLGRVLQLAAVAILQSRYIGQMFFKEIEIS